MKLRWPWLIVSIAFIHAVLALSAVADGDTPLRIRVEIDEYVDGDSSKYNYGMYLVSGQLERAGFKVIRGRPSAWSEEDPKQEVDYIFKGRVEIAFERVSITYGDTVAVMYRRSGEGSLISASQPGEVLASVSFDEVKGVARESYTVRGATRKARIEAQQRAGNILAIELFRDEKFQPLIPEATRERVRGLIESYLKTKKNEQ